MTGPLLYTMFKSKTKHPLHAAVRLRREDVVFLYLIEYMQEVSLARETCHRQCDTRGTLCPNSLTNLDGFFSTPWITFLFVLIFDRVDLVSVLSNYNKS
jgi:hypothetical protein